MLTDLQKRKLTRMFHVFDTNHDGVLEEVDYLGFADNLVSARGLAPDSPMRTELRARYQFVWANLSRATGGKPVTPEVFLGFNDALLADKANYDRNIAVLVDTAFKTLDADGDGKVTLDEYRVYLRAHGLDEKLATEIFPRLDLNGDGHLSVEEVEKLIHQFYFSDDPASPGNLVLGPY